MGRINAMIVYRALLWLAISLISQASTSLQDVHYISWLETLNTNAGNKLVWRNSTQLKILHDISNADDLFQKVTLPFGFPFLGVKRFEAFIGSNGYVQFDSTNSPPCISQISSRTAANVFVCFQSEFTYQSRKYTNDFNNSYYGMIAAFTADLYPPFKYPASSISWEYAPSDNSMIIYYNQIPFYNYSMATINNTFHIKLQSDGSTTVFYENINYDKCAASPQLKSYDGKCYPSFVVGLRDSISDRSPSYFTQSATQLRTQSAIWGTAVQGVYPPSKSLIKSQTLFHSCPISDSWCMYPRVVAMGSTANFLNLSTLSTSCMDKFVSYNCSFSTSAATVSSIATLYIKSGEPSTFRCSIPPSIITAVGNVTVSLLGTTKKTVPTSTFVSGELFSLSPTHQSTLSLNLMSNSFTLQVVSAPGAAQLASCSASSSLKALKGSCPECSACTGTGLKCLTSLLPCDTISSTKMCNGKCHISTSWTSSDTKMYQSLFWSSIGTCCDADLLDCAGECRGGTVVARRYYVDELGKRSNVCCAKTRDCDGFCGHDNAPQLDCQGVCGGTAKVDGCGVCSGGTSGKAQQSCELEFKFSDNRLNTSIPYVSEPNWATNKSGVAFRNITLLNMGPLAVTVVASLPPDGNVDPMVKFVGSKQTEKVMVLSANTSLTIPISVSLARIFKGKSDRWTEKQVKFEYSADSADYKAATKGYLDVQTSVPNCESVNVKKLCMTLPLCMWCEASSPPVRLTNAKKIASRRLFNLIAPSAVERVFETKAGSGFCSTGFDQKVACDPFVNETDDSQGDDKIPSTYIVPLLIIIAPVIFLLYMTIFSRWSQLF